MRGIQKLFGLLLLLKIIGCSPPEWKSRFDNLVKEGHPDSTTVKAYSYVLTPGGVEVGRDALMDAAGFDIAADLLVQDPYWRPRRHSGPFLSGSDFEHIRIGIYRSSSSGTLYLNEFAGSLDATVLPIYNLYWNNAIPSNSSANLNLHTNMLLSLKRIEYSSRYGGTVCLVFRFGEMTGYEGPRSPGSSSLPEDRVFHPEEFGYDIHTANYQFDVGELELKFFVGLKPDRFNPTTTEDGGAIVGPDGEVAAEVRAEEVYVYDGGSRIVDGSPQMTAALLELQTRLEAIESDLAASLRIELLRHTYAFVHDQFNAEFNQGESLTPRKVESLLIADDFVDLTTRPGLPFFTVNFRGAASGNCVGCDFPIDDTPDIRMSIHNEQVYRLGHDPVNFTRVFDFDEELDISVETPWVRGAFIYLSDCPKVDHIRGVLTVTDRDAFLTFGDDGLTSLELNLQPVCGVLEGKAGRGEWGVVDTNLDEESAASSVSDRPAVTLRDLNVRFWYRVRLDVR